MAGKTISGSEILGRLLSRTEKVGDCWIYQGSLGHYGYGKLRIFQKIWMTHRLSYTLFHGPIPEGLSILHSCDKPACINPAHLRAGTQLENVRDREERNPIGLNPKRNKFPKGDAHFLRKRKLEKLGLPTEQVPYLKSLPSPMVVSWRALGPNSYQIIASGYKCRV